MTALIGSNRFEMKFFLGIRLSDAHAINVSLRPLLVSFARSKSSSAANETSSVDRLVPFVEKRLNLWSELSQNHVKRVAAQPQKPIKVDLINGPSREAVAWRDTPFQLAGEIDRRLTRSALAAKVNGVLWDLNRPLEKDCRLEFIGFDDAQGKDVFWHSSAHILGAALELKYGGLLTCGPATENGFFYDIFMGDETVVSHRALSAQPLTSDHFYSDLRESTAEH